jgi:hypothetical protein
VASGLGCAPWTNPLWQQRAEYHAQEAERLLAGRLGFINNVIKAGVHATPAVYYGTQAQRVA